MPELPEVETTKRNLEQNGLVGLTVTAVTVNWERTVGGDRRQFTRGVVNRHIIGLVRRAKYLIIELHDNAALVVHLRMSGRLHLLPQEHELTGYERVILRLDDGRQLRFHDTRKFGRMLLSDDHRLMLRDLAVEPFSSQFTPAYTLRYLKSRARLLKPLMLDQRGWVAGIGNIYADEALWEARLHPERFSNTLTKLESDRLHKAVKGVVKKGIDNLGTSLGTGMSNFRLPAEMGQNQEQLRVFRRTDEPCYVCQSIIKRLIVGQRATHICPVCQTLSPT